MSWWLPVLALLTLLLIWSEAASCQEPLRLDLWIAPKAGG
jgi:hypothetical protein